MDFRRKIKLKDSSDVLVRTLSIKDVISLNKMFSILSDQSKQFFHPHFVQPNLGPLWIRDEILLVLSCFFSIRKLLLRIFPNAVYLSLIGLNSRNEIIAFACLRITERLPRGEYVASNGIIVRDDYQGRGLGSQLADCRIEFARIHKVEKIFLQVHAHNVRHISMLRKHGFRLIKTGRKDLWKGKSYPACKMVLDLSERSI